MTDADTDQVREGMPSSDPLIGEAVEKLKAELGKDIEAAIALITENVKQLLEALGLRIDGVEERLSKLEAPGDARDLGEPVPTAEGLQSLTVTLADRVSRLEGKLKHR